MEEPEFFTCRLFFFVFGVALGAILKRTPSSRGTLARTYIVNNSHSFLRIGAAVVGLWFSWVQWHIDFITVGQYLQPTRKHAAIDRFVTPDEFGGYAATARAKGFLMVAATPLTRSSHHADEDFERLKAARASATR